MLRRWINNCENARYSALTFSGGAAWRAALLKDADFYGDGAADAFRALIETYDDAELQAQPRARAPRTYRPPPMPLLLSLSLQPHHHRRRHAHHQQQ